MIDVAMRQRWADILRQHGLPPIKVHVTYDYSLPDDEEDAEPGVPEGYMSAAKVCELLGCSRPQLTHYMQRGYIEGQPFKRAKRRSMLIFASAAVLRLRALLDEFAHLHTYAKARALAAALQRASAHPSHGMEPQAVARQNGSSGTLAAALQRASAHPSHGMEPQTAARQNGSSGTLAAAPQISAHPSHGTGPQTVARQNGSSGKLDKDFVQTIYDAAGITQQWWADAAMDSTHQTLANIATAAVQGLHLRDGIIDTAAAAWGSTSQQDEPTATEERPENPTDLVPGAEDPHDGEPGTTAAAGEYGSIHYVAVDALTLSPDVPQFKEGADAETGEVEPFENFDERVAPPIHVWRRLDGRLEVISGRHRFQARKRDGGKTIMAYIHDEAAGFTKKDAAALDATLNIKEGQGSVLDWARYVRDSGMTMKEARAKGLLRGRGRLGITIGLQASDDLFSRFSSGSISEDVAAAIAAFPDPNLQRAGMRCADKGMKAGEVSGVLHVLQQQQGSNTGSDMGKAPEGSEGDWTHPTGAPRRGEPPMGRRRVNLFGANDDALNTAERMGQFAAAMQQKIRDRLNAVRGAAKRPETARTLGVDISDPAALSQKVAELNAQLRTWQEFYRYPELMAQASAWDGNPDTLTGIEPAVAVDLSGGNSGFSASFDMAGAFADEKETIKQQAIANGEIIRNADGTLTPLAPNGKPSKLTLDQWLAVRTPAFYSWFGNWNARAIVQKILALRATPLSPHEKLDEKQMEAVFASLGKVTNKNMGRIVRFPTKSAGKIFRHQGFDTESIVYYFRELFENAVYAFSLPEVQMAGHRYHSNYLRYENYVNKFSIGGETYYIRFTVPIIRKAEPPHNLHSTAISEVHIYSKGGPVMTLQKTAGSGGHPFTDDKLAQFFDLVNGKIDPLFECSKVVDENGEPLVVYHYTDEVFTSFKMEKARLNSDIQAAFFMDNEEDWQDMGGRKMACFLNIRKPVEKPMINSRINEAGKIKREELIAQGYDGTFFTEDGRTEWAAFYPTQIKSAISRLGVYDPANSNISFSLAGEKEANAVEARIVLTKEARAQRPFNRDLDPVARISAEIVSPGDNTRQANVDYVSYTHDASSPHASHEAGIRADGLSPVHRSSDGEGRADVGAEGTAGSQVQSAGDTGRLALKSIDFSGARSYLLPNRDGTADSRLTSTESLEEAEVADNGGSVSFSLRTAPPPTKTGIGYKVFYHKDGKLYPPMVANPGGKDTPVGVWLDADEGVRAADSKTGRPQVKAGGKGTQGGSGTLSYRLGWHLGEIPYALQFNRVNPDTGKKELFPADFVWAEVEYAMDEDYQEEAMSYGYTENGKFRHSYAGLPRLPKNGFYRYRTNPNPATDPWIITGAMKVNRVLSNEEVDELVRAAGREPQRREGESFSIAEANSQGIMKEGKLAAANGTLYDMGGASFSILARHASPHSGIRKFLLKFINTGEGSQMEGWGLYFSTSTEAHEHYVRQFARTKWEHLPPMQEVPQLARHHVEWALGNMLTAKNEEESERDRARSVRYLLGLSKERDEDAQLFEKSNYEKELCVRQAIAYKKAAEILKSARPEDYISHQGTPASEYEVMLNFDRNGSDLLRWDEDFQEQSEKVKQFMVNTLELLDQSVNARAFLYEVNWTGWRLYDKLEQVYGSPKAASEALLAAGIRGVEYRDSGSRETDEDVSYNYVVFDEADVKIIRYMDATSGYEWRDYVDDTASFSLVGEHAANWEAIKHLAFIGRDDGKLRVELDASQARISPDVAARILRRMAGDRSEKKTTFRLADILDYPALYAAYPKLAKMGVHLSDLGARGTRAWYNRGSNNIRINTLNFTLDNYDAEALRSTLLHEVQHAIQHIEGYAGGNGGANWDEYQRSAGEIEARAVQKRRNMTAEERAATPVNDMLEHPGRALVNIAPPAIEVPFNLVTGAFEQEWGALRRSGNKAHMTFVQSLINALNKDAERLARYQTLAEDERGDMAVTLLRATNLAKAAVMYLPKGWRIGLKPYLDWMEVFAEVAHHGTMDWSSTAVAPFWEQRMREHLKKMEMTFGWATGDADQAMALLKDYGETRLFMLVNKLLKRVSGQLEEYGKGKLRDNIAALLESIAPKLKDNRRTKRGVISLAAFEEIARLNRLMQMDEEEYHKEHDALTTELATLAAAEAGSDTALTSQERKESIGAKLMELEVYGCIGMKSIDELDRLLTCLTRHIRGEKAAWQAAIEERQERRRAIAEGIIAGVKERKGEEALEYSSVAQAHDERKASGKRKGFFRRLGIGLQTIESMPQLLAVLAKHKDTAALAENIRLRLAMAGGKIGIQDKHFNKLFRNWAAQAFGIDTNDRLSNFALDKALADFNRSKDTGIRLSDYKKKNLRLPLDLALMRALGEDTAALRDELAAKLADLQDRLAEQMADKTGSLETDKAIKETEKRLAALDMELDEQDLQVLRDWFLATPAARRAAEILRKPAEERTPDELSVINKTFKARHADITYNRFLREQKTNLQLSQNAALYIVLAYEQEDNRARMESQGWTPDIIDRLRAFIGAAGLKLGESMRHHLNTSQRERIARIFERENGVPFANIPNYFPLRFQIDADELAPMLAAYYADRLAEDKHGKAFHRPRPLKYFFEDLEDIIADAEVWAKETGWGRKPRRRCSDTPQRAAGERVAQVPTRHANAPQIEPQDLTPEQQAELDAIKRECGLI